VQEPYQIQPNNVEAPDGTTTADKVTLTNGTTHQVSDGCTVTPLTAYTFSIWVKLGTASDLKYAIYDSTNSADIIAPTFCGATESWARYSATFTTPAGCIYLSVRIVKDSAQDDGETAYIWGAQLEIGSVVKTYVPTLDKQTLMDYSKARKNLLLPNQANCCEDGTTTGISANGATVTASTAAKWQGTYSAKVVTNNATTGEGFYLNATLGLKPSTAYTASVYMRGDVGGETVRLRLREYSDPSTPIAYTTTDVTLTTDWQRVVVTKILGSASNLIVLYAVTSAQQASTYYVDGFKLEESPSVTDWEAPPNIGILGGTTAANTNDPTWTGNGAYFITDDFIQIPKLPLTGDLTVMAVATVVGSGAYKQIFSQRDNTTTNSARCQLAYDTAEKASMTIKGDDGTAITSVGAGVLTGTHCVTAVLSGTTQYLYQDMSLVDSDAGCTAVTLDNDAYIGATKSSAGFSNQFNSNIMYVVVYNRALTGGEIAKNYAYLKSYLLRNRGIVLP
jgi:Concanavalin A-like lectin/glucanases superfamily/Carbohydrate binding domain